MCVSCVGIQNTTTVKLLKARTETRETRGWRDRVTTTSLEIIVSLGARTDPLERL